MTSTRNHKDTIWQGFAAGALAGGAVIYLLGTKRGRGLLKRAVEMAEDMEVDLGKYLEGVEEHIKEELEERIIPILPHTPMNGEETTSSTGLTRVIDRIKN